MPFAPVGSERIELMGEKILVVRRECDKAMAEKKGFFPCNEDCKRCHACIEVKSNGNKEHVSLLNIKVY